MLEELKTNLYRFPLWNRDFRPGSGGGRCCRGVETGLTRRSKGPECPCRACPRCGDEGGTGRGGHPPPPWPVRSEHRGGGERSGVNVLKRSNSCL